MKTVLLGTTGTSPQVITETLHAIAHSKDTSYHWPQELHIITTMTGSKAAMEGLIGQGQLARLCQELGKPMPAFGDAHLHIIEDRNSQQLEDSRTVDEHNAVADFITTTVRNFTQDEDTRVIASLAGGRKTMTFYMGYAMGLFGRQQDRLTHVLIEEGFENNPNFWFPTSSPEYRYIQTRSGEALDASTAQVTLAGIPFVRHRHILPQSLLTQERVDFTRLVYWINLGDQRERIVLQTQAQNYTINVTDVEGVHTQSIALSLMDFAFYQMMARATLHSNASLVRPADKSVDDFLRVTYVHELLKICVPKCVEKLHGKPLPELLDAIEAWQDEQPSPVLASKSMELWRGDGGFNKGWFDDRNTAIKKQLSQHLPSNLVECLSVCIVYDEEAKRLADKSRKNKGGYGINLPLANIQLS